MLMCVLQKLMIIKNPDPDVHQSSTVFGKGEMWIMYIDLKEESSLHIFYCLSRVFLVTSPRCPRCQWYVAPDYLGLTNSIPTSGSGSDTRLQSPGARPLKTPPPASPSSEQTMLFQSVGGHLPRQCDLGVIGVNCQVRVLYIFLKKLD